MDTRTKRSRHPHSITIGALVQAYLNHAQNTLAETTYASYATSLRLFVEFVGADTPVEDCTDLAIVRWMKARSTEGKSPNTVRADHRRLRYGLFSWALERKLVARNWASLAKPPAEPDKPGRSVSAEDFGKMLAVCAGSPNEYRDKALLFTLWDTGMRAGEIRQLETRDARLDDKDDAFIHVRAETTKTHQDRFVPITPDCRTAIYDYLAFERGMEPGTLFLSSTTGEMFHEQTIKHLVREIGERAKVKVGAHDFRRAVVERLQRGAVPDTLIMRITGHKSTAMIARYGARAASENARVAYRRVLG